ncbi:tRNA N6-adenosine threonylcarbamoyltransferase [Thoreauomyces humboldtii]|nr:tRNA N6-adenosine threonylcarbamoyltransferase [Thoreauomyces humboldtii]
MAGRIHPVETTMQVLDLEEGGETDDAPRLLIPKDEDVKNPPVPINQLWKIAAIASTASGVVNPVAVQMLGDSLKALLTGGLSDGQDNGFYSKSLWFTILAYSNFAFVYVSRSLWLFAADRQIRGISTAYLKSVLHHEMAWFDTAKDESLSARLSKDVPLIRKGFGENSNEKVGTLFNTIGCMVSAVIISFMADWHLTLIMLVLMPLLAFLGNRIVKVDAKAATATNRAYAGASTIAEQALNGIRTVSAFSMQKRFSDRYNDELLKVQQLDTRKGKLSGLAIGMFQCGLLVIFILAILIASLLVKANFVDGGDAVVVLLAQVMLAGALSELPPALSSLAQAQSAARVIYNTILNMPEVSDDSWKAPTRIEGRVSFKAVHFNYPARPDVPILKGLTIDIKRGQTIAFVGESGSGKSTTIALLQRFYRPKSGKILIDGTDIQEMELRTLRDNIAVVGQEPVLFQLTLKQNILLGAIGEVSPAKFIEVCKMAQCHDFVAKLPLGYDTPFTPGVLSGGQKQRIAIARALIKDPSILLLDEATSALDTKSERLVQKALDLAAHGRTSIIIAHRMSTVRNADVICAMKRGSLIESGSHDELYALNGVYTQLVNKQRLFGDGTATQNPSKTDTDLGGDDSEYRIADPEHVRDLLSGPSLQLDTAEITIAEMRMHLRQEKLRRERERANRSRARGVAPSETTYQRVKKMMEPEKRVMFWGTVCAGGAGMVIPGFASMLGQSIGSILKKELPSMWIAFLGFFAYWGQEWLNTRANAALAARLRIALFDNLLRQEMGFFDSPANSSGIPSRKLGDLEGIGRLVTSVRGDIVMMVFAIFNGLTVPMFIGPLLAVILMCLLPFIFLASYWQVRSVAVFSEATREALDQATQVASEGIREVKTFKALGNEAFAVDRYDAFLQKPFELSKRNAFVEASLMRLRASRRWDVYPRACSWDRYKHGLVQLYAVISVTLSIMVTMVFASRAAGAALVYTKSKILAEEIFELLDRTTSIDPDQQGHDGPFEADFKFQNLAFQYPTATEPTFHGMFSLEGERGKSLALVGASGCGKSTVIALLQRWYDVNNGAASINDIPIRSYALSHLRSNMALVGQEPVLFDLTIAENIAWGSERSVTFEEIRAAAAQANVLEFVDALPDGFDTRVGEKGGHLSGGQKQRIAIARALIRQPKLLLLDEATSALDSHSEVEVQRAIDAAAVGRTTVTVAHRLSTIKNVDCIAVVSNGRVVEMGRHGELVARNGIYAEMCRSQNM